MHMYLYYTPHATWYILCVQTVAVM